MTVITGSGLFSPNFGSQFVYGVVSTGIMGSSFRDKHIPYKEKVVIGM